MTGYWDTKENFWNVKVEEITRTVLYFMQNIQIPNALIND